MAGERKSMKQRTTEKIQAGMIADRLEKHVNGEVELTSTQVAAARILLDKVIPNQTASESKVTVNNDTKPSPADRQEARHILQALNGGKSA